MTGETIIVQLD